LTDRQIILRPSEHPAASFAVARHVQQALADQPHHVAVTAAKLASEIVEDLTRQRAVRLVHVDLDIHSGEVTTTVRCLGSAPDAGWKLEGLARLLLDRLATNWGEEPQTNQIWFDLADESSRPLRGAA
jgi:hypothetical protein